MLYLNYHVIFCVPVIYDRGIQRFLCFLIREVISIVLTFCASLVAQMVKCLPTMRETWVLSLGWEDPLEEDMATHSSTLAWKIPWTEEPGGLQSMGLQRVGHG